jgi:hypothetical protein
MREHEPAVGDRDDGRGPQHAGVRREASVAVDRARARARSRRDHAGRRHPPDAVVVVVGDEHAAVRHDVHTDRGADLRGRRGPAVTAEPERAGARDRRDDPGPGHAPDAVVWRRR